MSNITTDLQSFEDVNYPKNIYELLLKLKNEPLQINCNSSNSNTSGSYQKYNSEETLLRVDSVYGEIFTKTFYQDLECDYSSEDSANIPQYFEIYDELFPLNINYIIDFSAKLSDFKFIPSYSETRLFKNYVDLTNSIYIDDEKFFLTIPTAYDMNDTSVIVNKDIYPYRKFVSFITLVYTKNQP